MKIVLELLQYFAVFSCSLIDFTIALSVSPVCGWAVSYNGFKQKVLIRDGRIPLFSDIRILGYLGYWFFLDTWISGYLDIMDIWIHGYLDTWISVFFGYMDTWILWISIFFIIHILDILSKYPDIFGYFFKLLNVEKRQSNSIVKIMLYVYFVYW